MRDDWRKAAPTSEGIERGGMEKPDREDENYWLPSSPSVSDSDDGREGDYWLPSSSGASVNGSAPVSHGKVDSAPESRGKVSTTPGNLGSGSQEKQTQGRIGRLVPTTEVGMKIWWKCNLCRFVVHDSSTANTRSTAHIKKRQRHLKNVHGFIVIPKLSKTGLATSERIKHTMDQSFNDRWVRMWGKYATNRWKGAHHIRCEVSRADPAGVKWHKCQDCGLEIRRGHLPVSVCYKDTRGGAQTLSQRARKEQWAKWRQEESAVIRSARKARLEPPMNLAASLKIARGARRKKLDDKRRELKDTLERHVARRGKRANE